MHPVPVQYPATHFWNPARLGIVSSVLLLTLDALFDLTSHLYWSTM